MTQLPARSRAVALLLAALLLCTAATGTATAASRAGGTVVVGPNETITDGLSAAGGTIEIYGTVRGDVQAAGGSVVVADGATVTGDVQATGGDVTIAGSVGGNVDIASGSATVARNATVAGNLSVAAGSAVVAGTVDGDAAVGADTITLASTARVGGDFVYDGTLTRETGSEVAGDVREDPSLGDAGMGSGFSLPSWLGTAYGFLVNLLVGAVLLAAFPRFSRDVADRVAGTPLRAAGVGLLALVATPILLFVVAITVVGLPLALAGVLVYALGLWVAAVYGQYALGAWLLSYTDRTNRYLALLVGALLLALLQFVPVLDAVVGFALLVLALGALASALYARYRAAGELASA